VPYTCPVHVCICSSGGVLGSRCVCVLEGGGRKAFVGPLGCAFIYACLCFPFVCCMLTSLNQSGGTMHHNP